MPINVLIKQRQRPVRCATHHINGHRSTRGVDTLGIDWDNSRRALQSCAQLHHGASLYPPLSVIKSSAFDGSFSIFWRKR